jgi:hypothetical protein
MSHPLKELRAMSKDELIANHDHLAKTTSVGVNYYLDELARRDAAEVGRRPLTLTWVIAALTLGITILTVANLIAVLGH